MRRLRLACLAAIASLQCAPLAARHSLGVFDDWGAFFDADVPRCYAIAEAENAARDNAPYASIGTWPKQRIRGQVHFRLSRKMEAGTRIRLLVGNKRFTLAGGGGDAWAANRRMDAEIIAAMRAHTTMWISATDIVGRRFSDKYSLAGAATAMDAATVGCARIR